MRESRPVSICTLFLLEKEVLSLLSVANSLDREVEVAGLSSIVTLLYD